MPLVLIQPSIGNPASRDRWRDTMAKPVHFNDPDHARHLTPLEREALLLLHPDGRAPFWGVSSYHDKNAAKLRLGDIVLFTGQNRAFAAGEVGATFRNSRFADLLWPPKESDKGWQNVYSLLHVEPTDVPYPELARLCGYKPNYGFPGAVFLEDGAAEVVLDGLRISPATAPAEGSETSITGSSEPTSFVVPVERHTTSSTAYHREAGTTLVNRAEGALVDAFLATLPENVVTGRLRTPSGHSDILTVGPDGTELIEAKSNAGHFYVRQALGQLLDYASHSEESIDRLAALLPERPGSRSVALLHRYGIDCIYRQGPVHFARLSAPDPARHDMRLLWAASPS